MLELSVGFVVANVGGFRTVGTYFSRSLKLRMLPFFVASSFHTRFLRKTAICPELPRSPSLAYETLQSKPFNPGTRQQSNIHLQIISFQVEGAERVNAPVCVHAVGTFFGAVWFDLTAL